jgi:hypothetical protein
MLRYDMCLGGPVLGPTSFHSAVATATTPQQTNFSTGIRFGNHVGHLTGFFLKFMDLHSLFDFP